MDPSKKHDRTAALVIAGMLVIVTAPILAAGIAFAYLLHADRHTRRVVEEPPAPTEVPAIPAPPAAAPPAPLPPAPSASEAPPPAPFPDMKHVDPAEIYPEAKRIAQAINAHAELHGMNCIVQNGGMVGGTVDLTGDSFVVYTFTYSYLDVGAPAGKDVVQGEVMVVADHRGLSVGVLREPPPGDLPPFAPGPTDPRCSVRDAWRTAVESGVPEDAVASLRYYDDGIFERGGGYVWSFFVEGHGEHRREIDGRTCKLVKAWGAVPEGKGDAGSATKPHPVRKPEPTPPLKRPGADDPYG